MTQARRPRFYSFGSSASSSLLIRFVVRLCVLGWTADLGPVQRSPVELWCPPHHAHRSLFASRQDIHLHGAANGGSKYFDIVASWLCVCSTNVFSVYPGHYPPQCDTRRSNHSDTVASLLCVCSTADERSAGCRGRLPHLSAQIARTGVGQHFPQLQLYVARSLMGLATSMWAFPWYSGFFFVCASRREGGGAGLDSISLRSSDLLNMGREKLSDEGIRPTGGWWQGKDEPFDWRLFFRALVRLGRQADT